MTEVRVWVRAVETFKDLEYDARRTPGDEWETPVRRARKLAPTLVTILDGPGGAPVLSSDGMDPWYNLDGRDLRTTDERPAGWRVVACLNVWNDVEALQWTMPTWRDHVDWVLAVDGAYAGAPAEQCGSTDGTVEYLREQGVHVIVPPPGRFWPDQVTKRNAYMDMLQPADLAFVVDADEFVFGADCLRGLGPLEVGWVPYRKGIYTKEQNFPRLYAAAIKPRYTGRHYWVTGSRGFVTDCQTGGAGYDHAWVPLRIDNTRGRAMRPQPRNRAKSVVQAVQLSREAAVPGPLPAGREALRIVQLAHLDAGMVVFRLHTALNATTPHTSVMGAWPHERPWGTPRQYDLTADRAVLRHALTSCDVVHCHLSYQVLDQLGVPIRCPVVIHHHGTMYRRAPEARNAQDARRAAVRFVSNPELLKYGGDDLHYLPNPVPVAQYRRLREALYRPDPDGWFRVGHSPSKRELKGTEDFLQAVERLRAGGLKIRPVLIEDMPHGQCLRVKAAECDAFFDSFWLGLQCSGLEAGAMGVPVLAGDPDVRAYYARAEPPYVYANDREELEHRLANMCRHRGLVNGAGTFLQAYITDHHDYAAVTARYLDVLDERLDWRRRLALSSGTPFLTA